MHEAIGRTRADGQNSHLTASGHYDFACIKKFVNKIPRRDFLKLTGAAGAGLAAWPLVNAMGAPTTDKPRRPNILVFLTDDQGQWAQHAYGNSELITPNLDRLAGQGTRLTNAFTTCPVCSPARASFFTGRMPSQHGIHDFLMEGWINDGKPGWTNPWLKGQTLISELMKSSGYHTGLVGKYHCGYSRSPQPGFDRWFSYWNAQYPHVGTQHFTDQDKLVVEEGCQSPLLTERALDFLQEHQKNEGAEGKPFFLYISYVDTHGPHNGAPDDLVEQYQSATFKDIPDERFMPCHGETRDSVSQTPHRNARNALSITPPFPAWTAR